MNSWQQVRIGDVLTKTDDWTEIVSGQNCKQVTVRLWGKGVVLRNEIDGSKIAAKRRRFVRPGQFILSRIDARNGAFGLVPNELDGAIVSNDFPSFEIEQERLMPDYLNWMSKTRDFVGLCQAASEGTTNRVRLQEDRFLAMTIPLPPLAEQQRIVARIDALGARIEEAKGLRAEAMAEVEAVMGAARASTFEELAKSGTQRLDSVADLKRGRFSHRPRNEPRFFGGVHPWIQIGEIESSGKYITQWTETLNDEGLEISRKFPRGTLLVSIAATIGAVGVLDFDCCIPDSIVAVVPRHNTSSEYLYHYLGYLRTHLESIAPQSAQKNINLRILSPLPVPLPSADEQRRIVAYLDDLQAKVDAVKRLQAETQAELAALLPSVLDRAFRGEL